MRLAARPRLAEEHRPTASPSRAEALVPYLPWLWMAGSLSTLALLATGLVGVEGLRRGSRPIGDGLIAALVGAALLGVVGALLAIPTAAAILMLTREVFVRRQDAR